MISGGGRSLPLLPVTRFAFLENQSVPPRVGIQGESDQQCGEKDPTLPGGEGVRTHQGGGGRPVSRRLHGLAAGFISPILLLWWLPVTMLTSHQGAKTQYIGTYAKKNRVVGTAQFGSP